VAILTVKQRPDVGWIRWVNIQIKYVTGNLKLGLLCANCLVIRKWEGFSVRMSSLKLFERYGLNLVFQLYN